MALGFVLARRSQKDFPISLDAMKSDEAAYLVGYMEQECILKGIRVVQYTFKKKILICTARIAVP